MRRSVALIIGLISLAIGLLLVTYRVSKIKSGIVTKATVVRVESKNDGDDVLFKPVLRFINYQNTSMLYKPYAWSADEWHANETVKLLYTKDHYDNISIISYWKTFGLALIFCCVALVSLLIAGGEYLASRFFKSLNIPPPVNDNI